MATVTKRGNSYRFTVSCGYDLNGKQIRKSKTWTPPEGMSARKAEKEAQHQAALFEEQCRSGQVLDGNVKLAVFTERWFTDYAEQHLKPATVNLYRHMFPRISAALGHIHIGKIQPHHLLEFYKNLGEDGVREDIRYRSREDFKARLPTTCKEFALQSGLGICTIYHICNGATVSLASAEKASAALNRPLEDVFERIGSGVLSGRTILRYHQFISSILGTAVQWQLIPSNPAERVKAPRAEHKEARYLDEEQAVNLIALLDNEPIQYRTAVLLLLNTGLRRGELLGLEWKDINLDKAILEVKHNSQYLPGRGVYDETPKTEGSRRAIKIPAACIPMLSEYRAWQCRERLKLGDQWHDYDKLFTQWNGKPLVPCTLTNWFTNFVRRNNLPHITLHSLRHTNASLLIAAGTNLRTVSARLGHASTTTTANIYAHAIKSADAAAAEILDDILSPKQTPLLKAVNTK